jgi:hypothetical protein
MTLDEILPETATFSFRSRPGSVPGDLRISWRLGVVVLILRYSRSRKASLPKLHLLNDAIRSKSAMEKLADIIAGNRPTQDWRIRVEPALGRALDFARGEGLVEFKSGPSYQLGVRGVEASDIILKSGDVLTAEREFLGALGQAVTEKFVNDLVRMQANQ